MKKPKFDWAKYEMSSNTLRQLARFQSIDLCGPLADMNRIVTDLEVEARVLGIEFTHEMVERPDSENPDYRWIARITRTTRLPHD